MSRYSECVKFSLHYEPTYGPDDFKPIWDALECDDLPAGVDLMVFDFAVSEGCAASLHILQESVGIDPSPVVNHRTIRAVWCSPSMGLILHLAEEQTAFRRKSPQMELFGKCGIARTQARKEEALKYAGADRGQC